MELGILGADQVSNRAASAQHYWKSGSLSSSLGKPSHCVTDFCNIKTMTQNATSKVNKCAEKGQRTVNPNKRQQKSTLRLRTSHQFLTAVIFEVLCQRL